MTSDTRNIKLGVCRVYFDGVDLGYTKGGVEVSVSTDTHKVEVDQFGKTPVNESILGRELKVKVPMAETTLENMVKVMPGATLIATGGVKATGTYTMTASNPTNDQTIILNGITITFKSASPNGALNQVLIGADVDASGANLAAFLQATTEPALAAASYTYTAATNVLAITYNEFGVAGNAYTVAAGTYGGTVSGATLAGGVDPTKKRVDVTSGVGTDLLTIAKELRLHPKALADSDKSEDFIIPLAATAGALTYAYKQDEERIYNVEFMGYPDSANNEKMFSVGDPSAT
jgi:hypothetical protein